MSGPEAKPKPPNFLEINAAAKPDRPMVIGSGRTITWGEMRERSRALAKSLYGLGLRPGQQAALMTYNLPEYYEIREALNYLSVGLVMVGYRSKPPEIEYIVENSESRAVFFWHEFADRILPHRRRYANVLPAGFVSFGGKAPEGATALEAMFANPPVVDLEHLPQLEEAGSTMVYTSGTTGRPKGAARRTDMATRPGVMEYLFATVAFAKLTPDEVHLVCCPLYHSGPSYFALLPFIMGGTLVLQPRFDPEEFFELVAKHRVTSTHVVPTMLNRLLQVPEEFTRKLDLSSLRSLICGAAPLFPETKLAALDRFGPILHEYYGATETGVNTFISPEEIRQRPSSVGKPFSVNELKILDESGNEVPDGARGVLYMHNPILMEGYYKNEAATAETRRGKFMTVGDVAVRDADGYYYIVDRVKDMIIRGGVNVYPAEVEEVLCRMPDIQDAAVVGKPDPEWGETVAAFVVPRPGARVTEEEIQAFCAEQLSNHKIPATIVFTEEIPRTPTGKILKRELREALA